MIKRSLILSCSLCSNYDSNRSVCKLTHERRDAISYEYAPTCKDEGEFIRYMNVIPDAYNYYAIDEEIPGNWKPDLSKLPKDEEGFPLFVVTKRGLERAIPANDSVGRLKADMILGVPRILTHQGQRELIYDLGVTLSQKEAQKAGVELTVLPEEEGWEGIESIKRDHEIRGQVENKPRTTPWLSDEPVERWD
jgi:hypothetical protein